MKSESTLALYQLSKILYVVLHIWTIIIAFETWGILAAIPTALFFIVGEIFWLIKEGVSNGFDSPYCISVIVFFCIFAVMMKTSFLSNKND